jgi:putative ABC transport system ATP-binding protein
MKAFNIKNLECAYADGKTVLHVPDMEVPFGKILVFLGPSGVGKSTLLETLGLMNNTIKSGEVSFANSDYSFHSLWNEHVHEIPRIRSEYMSFIFQENNLLDNLTAMENAMIPLLIQGVSEEDARGIVMDWCQEDCFPGR